MTMIEAIITAQDQGGSYIAQFEDGWRLLGRNPKGKLYGLIWVAFDGSTARI